MPIPVPDRRSASPLQAITDRLAALNAAVSIAAERWIVTRLVPRRVGPVMRLVFKTPILLYRAGLGPVIGGRVLVLWTTGRKTGRPRATALEYGRLAGVDALWVMTGWGGRAEWYRNALREPRVTVWAGRRRYSALAARMPVEVQAAELVEMARQHPPVVQTWAAVSGIPFDGTPACFARYAEYFPALVLRPDARAEG